ncbi:DUF3426 domain-containing protein [Desulfocurvus sp. DL9XJH121]
MIVECPSCTSTFNLPDELVPEAGRKVKCSVCEHVFEVFPDNGDGEDLDLSPAPGGGGIDEDEDDELGGALDEAFSLADADDDEDDSLAGGSDSGGEGLPGLDLDLDKPAKKKSGGKGKLVGIILAVVVLLAATGGAGVYFLAPGLLGLGPAAEEKAKTAPLSMAEQVRNIYLEGIRQYYVENDKAGRIFVVEGKAVNQFDKPKELVEVEANLYDAENKVLDTVRLMCGNTLSLFQLQVLSREEIEKGLADEAGIGANNVNLQPGQNVPFMVVFFNPSDSVAEFNVSVVAARDVDL